MKFDFAKTLNNAKRSIAKHSPEILTGVGIAGVVGTVVFAVRGTTKAVKLLDAKKEELKTDKLTVKETVKTAWKCYIPTATTGAASIACLVGANSVHSKRNAALAAAYKFSETALMEYRDKVIETVGEKKEKNIRESVIDDRMNNNPVSKNSVIVTGKGTSLCYDTMNDRYFESSYDQIKKAENIINRQLISSDYISLNDAYDELGLNHIPNGDRLGWNIYKLGKEGLEIDITTHMSDDDRPCLAIDFSVPPKYKFDLYN